MYLFLNVIPTHLRNETQLIMRVSCAYWLPNFMCSDVYLVPWHPSCEQPAPKLLLQQGHSCVIEILHTKWSRQLKKRAKLKCPFHFMKKLLVQVRCGKWFCIKSEDESVGAGFLWTEKGRTKSSNWWFAYLFLAYSLFLTPKNDTLIGVETFVVICQYAHGFLITQWAELLNGTAEKECILKLWCNAPQSKPDRQSPSKCLIIDKRVTCSAYKAWNLSILTFR